MRDLLPKDLREGLNSSRDIPGFCSLVLEIHPFPKTQVRNLFLQNTGGKEMLHSGHREVQKRRENKPTSKNSIKKHPSIIQLPVISPGLQMFPLINSTLLLEHLLMTSPGQTTRSRELSIDSCIDFLSFSLLLLYMQMAGNDPTLRPLSSTAI